MLKAIIQSVVLCSLIVGATFTIGHVAVASDYLVQQDFIVGEEVTPEEFEERAMEFLGWGIGIFIVLGIIGIIATVFWVLMIVHAATNNIEGRVVWILLMVFLGVIGAIIYYFVVKRNFAKRPSQTMGPMTMNPPGQ